MKKILFIITLFLSLQGIKAQTPRQRLLKNLQIEADQRNIVNIFIDQFADARRELKGSRGSSNKAKWQSVKDDINYSSLLAECQVAINAHYTDEEARSLLEANNISASDTEKRLVLYDPKPALTQELYRIGKRFGETINLQIQTILGENVENLDGNYASFQGVTQDFLISNDFRWKEEGNFKGSIRIAILPSKEGVLEDYNQLYIERIDYDGQIRRNQFVEIISKSSEGTVGRPHSYTKYYLSNNPNEKFSEASFLAFHREKDRLKKAGGTDSKKYKYIITQFYDIIKIINGIQFYYYNPEYCISEYSTEKVLLSNPNWQKVMSFTKTKCQRLTLCQHVIDKSCPKRDGHTSFFSNENCRCKYTKLPTSGDILQSNIASVAKNKQQLATFCERVMSTRDLRVQNPDKLQATDLLTHIFYLANVIEHDGYHRQTSEVRRRRKEIAAVLHTFSDNYYTSNPKIDIEGLYRVFVASCGRNYISRNGIRNQTGL